MTQLLLREYAIGHALGRDAHVEAHSAPPTGRTAAEPILALDVVTTFTGLEALEDDWNALFAASARSGQVFQSFNWCWHWCRHYLGESRRGPSLAVVTGRFDGRLVLIMPLVSERAHGVTTLSWLGEPVSQYGDIVVAPEAAGLDGLEAAWRLAVARTRADVANLRRVRADAAVAPLLDRLDAAVTAVEEAPFLALSGDTSFAGWETRRQPKARKNRRRQARRLADTGEIAFASHSGTPEAGRLAGEAVRLKRATLGAKGAFSLALADERFEAFFAEAAASTSRPAGVTVLALTSDGAPAALKILVETGDTACLHVAVFEPRFEKCGAGGLLLEHVVERTIAARRATFDLLPPRHDYKMEFADGIVVVADHALAVSTTGWLYTNGFLRVRRRLKATIEGLPLPVRRILAKLAG